MRKETTLRIFPWENELGAPFLLSKGSFPYAAWPCPLRCLFLSAQQPARPWNSSWVRSVSVKILTPGWMRQFPAITISLPVTQPVPLCSQLTQPDVPGMESSPQSTFPRKSQELLKLPPSQMRLAADQTSILLYCNKLLNVQVPILQSFHFIFNICGLSQIQKIIVNVHIQYLTLIVLYLHINILT